MFDKDAAQYMLTLVDGCLTYNRETAPVHEGGTTTHHHGETDHTAYLERPFIEARERNSQAHAQTRHPPLIRQRK